LIECVKPIPLDQAGCQTKSHGSVVSPLTGPEIERAAPGHVSQPLEGSPCTKLHGCADCVPRSKAEEAASKSVALVHLFFHLKWPSSILRSLRRAVRRADRKLIVSFFSEPGDVPLRLRKVPALDVLLSDSSDRLVGDLSLDSRDTAE